jgi:TATA-box binding protein (TBP) (component of TFIID and TFIIIB)
MCRKLEEKLGEVNNPIKTVNYTKVETDIDDDKILVKNSKSNNNFYNSICFSINIRENKNINLMIFTNGRITCTGSKNDDDGLNAVKLLVLEMKKIPEIFENMEDYNMVDIMNYDIVMINSNFFVGFFINNHKLYEILIRDRIIYQLFSSFDPRVYQGVKIYFMWNINQLVKNGVCICDKKCKLTAKKKRGEGNGDCRRISVAVFGTGKILIAGAKNDTQLIDTYNYIVKILQDNYIYIVQYSVEEKSKILNENIVKS